MVSVKSGRVRRREVFSSLLQADVSAVCQVGQIIFHILAWWMLSFLIIIVLSNYEISATLMYGCKQGYHVEISTRLPDDLYKKSTEENFVAVYFESLDRIRKCPCRLT